MITTRFFTSAVTAALLSTGLGTLSAASYATAPVTQQSASASKEFVGTLYSPSETMVATRMMGYIKRIAVEEGDHVSKGQLLFEVDPADVDAAQQQAGSAVIMAKSAYEDAKRDYERFSILFDKGAVPARDLEKMKLNMKVREEQLAMAKAGLSQAKAQSSYTTVRAPVGGVVVRKMANVSEMALPGHPVVVISSADNLRIQVTVPENVAGQFKAGDKAAVVVPSMNKTTQAVIMSVIPAADMATHSFVVKASLADKAGLMPGMYAKLQVAGAASSATFIPANALTKRGGISGVFAAVNGKAKFIPVKIVSYANDKIQVGGVASGMKVISYPKADLTDGMPLQ